MYCTYRIRTISTAFDSRGTIIAPTMNYTSVRKCKDHMVFMFWPKRSL